MVHHTTHPGPSNFYDLLRIPRDASLNEIKIAYRRTLLCLHPDKQPQPSKSDACQTTPSRTTGFAFVEAGMDPIHSRLPPLPDSAVDMALVREAYETLSDVRLRATYDGSLRRDEHAQLARGPPRPAQIISLEEFTATEGEMGSSLKSGTNINPAVRQEWQHRCRCGGMYRITEGDLENGTHLVGCENCSEVIWVGYQEVVGEDDEQE